VPTVNLRGGSAIRRPLIVLAVCAVGVVAYLARDFLIPTAAAIVLAPVIAVALLVGRTAKWWDAPGWTSTMVLLMAATGAILFALGVIAEYVGMAVNMAMGKPLYLPVRDRRDGPLGRDDA